MATLEEIAARNKKLGLPSNANMFHRGAERLNRLAWSPLVGAAKLPTEGARNILSGMLFGPKNTNPLSPAFGQRLHADGNKLKQISRAEYDEIMSGAKKGKAYKTTTGPMTSAYHKKLYRPGGLVGLAQKHPLMAGGAGLLAYYLATNAGARQAAGGMASGMSPTLNMAPTEAVQKTWAQPSYQNPLASDVWGK
tara:strand:- start:3670 stop:4251 length:582 start_codon:yes stop_codon:yes gene_type:complete